MAQYDELVNNGIGGSLDKPCAGTTSFLVCSYASTTAWASAAARMFTRVRRRWNAVATATTIPAQVIERVTALEKDYAALPPPRVWRGPQQQAAESATLASWMAEGAAVLRDLDAVKGAPAPGQTETQPKPDDVVSGGATIALGLGLAIIVLAALGFGVWAVSR